MKKGVRNSLFVSLVFVLSSLAWAQPLTVEQVEALREQARAEYTAAYPDFDTWAVTILAARFLVAQDPQDPDAQRLLAEIYTETHWWILAWEAWRDYRQLGGDWDRNARTQAALASRSLAFYAHQRDDVGAARAWLERAVALR